MRQERVFLSKRRKNCEYYVQIMIYFGLLLFMGFAVRFLFGFESDAAAIEEGNEVVELVA